MRIILPFLLDKLKQLILLRAEIKAITPGDCKYLSVSISSKVHKQISDTTIKRIYGFTYSKFLPSLYTLNTLAEYCDYASWEDFSNQASTQPLSTEATVVKNQELSIVAHTRKVSHKTLQTLNNRSIISYNLTIKRDFINEHLEIFSHSSQAATLFTAPAGFGKTIGLCHWVEQQLNNSLVKGSNDIVLFLSSKVLPGHTQGGSINDWLKALMGFSADNSGLATLLEDKQFEKSKFYLIIDGFDKDKFKPGDFELLNDLLIDVLALYRNHPGFKLILTMRSSNWISFRNRLMTESGMEQWFLGFMQDKEQENNMLLFSPEEVKHLSQKINPVLQNEKSVSPEVLSLFAYPLFFQYYYQKHPADFCLTKLDYFGIYEVISSYFLDKIFTARLSTEKVLIIEILLKNGKFQGETFVVDKLKVYQNLRDFWEAYDDLISIGFLCEINRSTGGSYAKYIEFSHNRLLAFCFARKLVYDNNELYDEALMHNLCETLNEGFRVPVLKWFIFNAIKAGQFDIFKHITIVPLIASEKAYLIRFLISLIKKSYLPLEKVDPLGHTFYSEQKELFYYLFGVEFVSPDYEDALKELLTLNLEDSSHIWVYTCLAIIYIVQLNSSGVEHCIQELQKFPDDRFNRFHINPLHCIDTIYYYFKFGIVKKEALAQITHFYFTPPHQNDSADHATSNHVMYLLALSTLGISNNKYKMLRFINVLEQLCSQSNSICPVFNFFLLVTRADSYLSLGKVNEGLLVYNELKKSYLIHSKTYTPYMQICYDMVTAKVLALTGQEKEAQHIIEKIMNTSAKLKFNYIEVNIIASYLSLPQENTTNDFYKNIYFKFIKLVRSSGFNPKSFLASYGNVHEQILA